jgi:methylated-DNA-[protein]-cysteine S-methyltransferase
MQETITMSNTPAEVARAALATPVGVLHLYGVPEGLLAVALPNDPRAEAEARLRRGMAVRGGIQFVDDEAALADALGQLRAWFAGERRAFDLPLAPRGTPFQLAVWDAVAAIPWGTTCSYADVARRIGKPAAVRAVGAANGANPLPLIIPCHRVIGANGALTGYGGGLPLKQQLLAWERGQTQLGGLR